MAKNEGELKKRIRETEKEMFGSSNVHVDQILRFIDEAKKEIFEVCCGYCSNPTALYNCQDCPLPKWFGELSKSEEDDPSKWKVFIKNGR